MPHSSENPSRGNASQAETIGSGSGIAIDYLGALLHHPKFASGGVRVKLNPRVPQNPRLDALMVNP